MPESARENLLGYCLVSTPNEVTLNRADRLADAFAAQVVSDLVDRCVTALDDGCSESDAVITIVRSCAQAALNGAPLPERTLPVAATSATAGT
ncbi:hypothetical protein WKI65_44140 [Streptomyces sp. MS1.AVA.3]|uniref:hypothetical protein n=1 Tax=Streptomyces decoyicus TaxID=249567 RepID=UPI0030BC516B